MGQVLVLELISPVIINIFISEHGVDTNGYEVENVPSYSDGTIS